MAVDIVARGTAGSAKELAEEVEREIGGLPRYKGTVPNYAALPTENVLLGDTYLTEDTDTLYLAKTVSPISWKDISGISLYYS